MFGVVRSGALPVRANERNQRGCANASGAKRSMVRRFIFSGMAGLPQSRPWEKDQSRVAMRPTAPAAHARSMRASIWSREPIQYTWKNVWGHAATTSSIGLLAKELRPIAVPRAAAAHRDGDLTLGVDGLDAGG